MANKTRNIESIKEDVVKYVNGVGEKSIEKKTNHEVLSIAKENGISIEVPDEVSNKKRTIILYPKYREVEERDAGAIVFHRRKRVVVPFGRKVEVPVEVMGALQREKRRIKTRKGKKKFILANRYTVEDVTKKMGLGVVRNDFDYDEDEDGDEEGGDQE